MQDRKENLEHLKVIASLLDTRFKGPFGIRFGLDALLGLIPGVGDFITSAMSLFIIAQAAAMGVGSASLIRMGLNVIFENLIDMIPLFGNLFDFYWKSNVKNMAILDEHLRQPARETIQSRMVVALVFIVLLLILIAAGYFTYQILQVLYFWITSPLD